MTALSSATSFETVVEQLLSWVKTTQQDNNVMHACLKEVDKIMKGFDNRWRVRPFGSAANGFSTRFSDLDVTCFQDADDGSGLPCASALETISQLHPLLQQHPSFEVLEVITSARIPLLKTRFEKKLEVDISFQNVDPLANTQLLRAYAEINVLVRHVAILIKLWAKAEGICGAQDGHLSSYSFTLMVIYCLQIDSYARLPCLPTDAYARGARRPALQKPQWNCQAKLSELLGRFFTFYATDFCWGYEVISPRVGKRLYTNDEQFSKLAGRDTSTIIHIEDPYLLGRNLSCVLGQSQQTKLMQQICEAHSALCKGQIPWGFWSALNSRRTLTDQLGATEIPKQPPDYFTMRTEQQPKGAGPGQAPAKGTSKDPEESRNRLKVDPNSAEKDKLGRSISVLSDSTQSGSSERESASSSSESSVSREVARKNAEHGRRQEVHVGAPSAGDVPRTNLVTKLVSTEPEHGTTWSL